MQMCKAFGICHHVDLKIVTTVLLKELVSSILRVQVAKEERCMEKVACYVRKGYWRSEIVGVEICKIDRALIGTKGRLRGVNKGWVYNTEGKQGRCQL